MKKSISITCKTGELIEIAKLELFQGDLKEITPEAMDKLKASIIKYGFSFPIFVWKTKILDGHQRLEAAKQLIKDGYMLKGGKLPVVQISAESDHEAAEKLLLINSRYAQMTQAGFDAFVTDFDIDLSDFSGLLEIPEIDFYFDGGGDFDGNTDPDEVPDVQPDIVSKRGDIWIMGDHRLMCGDSTLIDDVKALMVSEKANLIFTSPPYDNQRTYNLEEEINWPELMSGVFGNLICTDDCQVLVNLGLIHKDGEVQRYWDTFIDFMRESGWRFFGWYVWDKLNPLPGDSSGRLDNRHEFIFHFNRKKIKLIKVIECKRFGDKIHGTGRRRVDANNNDIVQGKFDRQGEPIGKFKVLQSVIQNHPYKEREGINHPAMFPVGLVKQIIETFPNNIIHEPFSGSGTTIIAAQKTNRRCFAMEISERYCDVSIRRWQDFTGQQAVLESTGEKFDDIPARQSYNDK